ncbi:MAG TPA: NusG domain II-containing protein [Candidatus Ozemobacteraceae bacterium]|nr:NusG domain II-containing protein [Candidatus Ozemobacteraceae bacterium]
MAGVVGLSAAALCAYNTREAGAFEGSNTMIVRSVDGPDHEYVLPAAGPSEITIMGRCGPMVVERGQNGLVRVSLSACPGQNCVRMGWVRPAEGIVCVPNGVLIQDSAPGPSAPDGIAR